MPKIPAHIFWPGFCVALLCFSVATGVTAIVAAQSDGGPQVVEDYKLGAEHWEKERQQAKENRKLGWSVSVEPSSVASPGNQASVDLVVRDQSGEALQGLEGSVELRSPAKSGALGESKLQDLAGRPGHYRVELPVDRRGLWDFVVKLEKNEDDFETRVRKML